MSTASKSPPARASSREPKTAAPVSAATLPAASGSRSMAAVTRTRGASEAIPSRW